MPLVASKPHSRHSTWWVIWPPFSRYTSHNVPSEKLLLQLGHISISSPPFSQQSNEGNVEYATVAMTFSLVDRTVDRATGRLVEGDDQPIEVTELLTFMRAPGGSWLLSAIQQA